MATRTTLKNDMNWSYGDLTNCRDYVTHSNKIHNFFESTVTMELYGEGNVSDLLNKICGRFKNISTSFIKKVYVNEKKRTVAVVFNHKFKLHGKEDPTNKIVVKCNEEETFDVYKAVSAACMIRNYGSNSAFKSHIRKTYGCYSDALYSIIARYLVSREFENWDNFIKAVDEAREDSHGRKETNTK